MSKLSIIVCNNDIEALRVFRGMVVNSTPLRTNSTQRSAIYQDHEVRVVSANCVNLAYRLKGLRINHVYAVDGITNPELEEVARRINSADEKSSAQLFIESLISDLDPKPTPLTG